MGLVDTEDIQSKQNDGSGVQKSCNTENECHVQLRASCMSRGVLGVLTPPHLKTCTKSLPCMEKLRKLICAQYSCMRKRSQKSRKIRP